MDEQPVNGVLAELRFDLRECWQKLPNKAFFLCLLAAWLALFQFLGNSTLGYIHSPSLLSWTLNAYSPIGDYFSSDDGHGVIIPFVVLALFWWKRKELMALPLNLWWPGFLLFGLALLLHIAAYMIQQPKLSLIAFFAGVYGLMGLAWGRDWLRASFFPFFLFAFCVPLGSQGQIITTPMRHLVATVVAAISHLGLAPDLVREGTQLFDAQNSFQYDIAPACSGIRSLVSLLALTTIFGFISFKTGWKRALMVLVAFPLAVIGNVVRITFTVVVAEAFGQDAGKWVEQKFGFVTFAIAIACVLLLEHWLREDRPRAGGQPEARTT